MNYQSCKKFLIHKVQVQKLTMSCLMLGLHHSQCTGCFRTNLPYFGIMYIWRWMVAEIKGRWILKNANYYRFIFYQIHT